MSSTLRTSNKLISCKRGMGVSNPVASSWNRLCLTKACFPFIRTLINEYLAPSYSTETFYSECSWFERSIRSDLSDSY